MEGFVRKIANFGVAILISLWSLLMLPVPLAHAAGSCTWNGSADGNWNNASNWDVDCGGGVPTNGDIVTLPGTAANKTMVNNIPGTLTLDQFYIADGYNLTGNDIIISGSMVFQSNGSTVNVASLEFSNASTGVSLQVDGTGNTIATPVGITLPAGDFNAYINSDFVAPAFTGSMTNFNKWGTASFTSASGSSYTTAGALNLMAGNYECSSSTCAGNAANLIAVRSGAKLLFTADATIGNDIGLNYNSGASTVGIELNDNVGVTVNGALTMNGPAKAQVGGSNASLQFLGGGVISNNLEAIGVSASASSFRVSSGGFTGSGELSCADISCWMQGNNSGYDGVIRGKTGSIIRPELSDSLGSTVGNTIIENGAQLLIADGSNLTTPENINVVGTGISGSGAIRNQQTSGNRIFTGTITLAGNTTFNSQDADAVGPAANLIFSGVINGSGNLTLTTSGYTGYIWLDGSSANTYSGTTKIDDGQVVLVKDPGVVAIPGNLEINSSTRLAQLQDNSGEQIADTSAVTLSETGSFNAEWQVAGNETVGSIAGDGDIYIVGGQTLHTGNDNSSTSYAGKITTSPNGSGTLDKVGTGTFTLTGTPTATFVPSYTVNGGVLSVQTDFSLAGFTVNNGGMLKGTGMAGGTTVNSGGSLSVGNSPGCMTFSTLTLSSGSNFDEEIAGGTACSQYDQTIVTGTANLNGATLNVTPSYTPSVGTVFTIIQAGNVTGTFNGLSDGATFTANGIQFRVNYTSTNVTLTVLGGTLAQTGSNTALITFAAIVLIVLAAGGLVVERISRRRKYANVK